MALRNARLLGRAMARVGGAVAAPVEAAAVVGSPHSAWGTRALHASSAPLTKGPSAPSPTARGPDGLIVPHGGGSLVDTLVGDAKKKADLVASCNGVELHLSDRNACDVELLTVGAFSPLTGFMDEENYAHVVEHMRLKGSNLLFGLPIVLDTDNESLRPGQNVLLTYKGQQVAVLSISSKYKPNKPKEAKLCYGTSSIEHPGVSMIASERGAWYLGGTLHSLALPTRAFPCATPRQVRASLPKAEDVVAFQCRNPIHRAHWELIVRSLTAPNVSAGAVVLVHPTVGPTQDDDIPGPVRVHTYEVLKAETAHPRVRWAYMPYSMHMAGPREAVQHMLLRKNYGCTHFVIGRDMAGSKSSLSGEDWYGAYDAQDFAKQHAQELGMQTVPSLNVVFTQEAGYVTADVAKAQGYKELKLSGTKFRQMLRAGDDIPEWFAFKSVVAVLRSAS